MDTRAAQPQPAAGRMRHADLGCTHCPVRSRCVMGAVPAHLLVPLEAELVRRVTVRRGELAVHPGQPFEALRVVRTGTLKVSQSTPSGREHVSDFVMPGDLIGVDAIVSAEHLAQVRALDDAQVCVLPFARLERVCAEHPQAQRSLHRAIGAQIAREQGMLQLLQRSAASQRVAAFLLGWGLRMRARGFSRDEFELRITQRALAAFLNLRPETLNRALHSLQTAGLLSFSARQVQIHDRDALLRLIDDDEAAARLSC